jgi:hypothetical protein
VTASRGTDNSTTATDHGPRAVRDALAQLVAAIVVHARRIRLPNSTSRSDTQPEQLERRARLVSAIAKGRRWLDDVVSGRVTTVQEICVRESCSVRQVNMTMSLAFLAPDLVKLPWKAVCPAASASSGSAIRRLNGAGSSRRSDLIQNKCPAPFWLWLRVHPMSHRPL